MKKNQQIIYWGILIVFAVALIVGLQSYSKSGNKESQSSTQTENKTTDEETGDISGNPASSDSSGNTVSSPESSSASQVLSKFLKAITGQEDKANIKNYTTSQFYITDFVKGIISGSLSGPDSADIMSSGELINGEYAFPVKESYNIDKNNNAGVNGTYFYKLQKINNQWLVNYRGETK